MLNNEEGNIKWSVWWMQFVKPLAHKNMFIHDMNMHACIKGKLL